MALVLKLKKYIFPILLIIYLLGFFSHAIILKKTVYGDGVFYYSWLRSIVIDHDFNFTNEYKHFGVTQPITPIGLLGNKYSIGPSLLWSPVYLWINSFIHGNGYEFIYQVAVGMSGVLLTIFSLILLYRLLLNFFSIEISLAAILSVAFATNLFFYGSLDVINSHALSFFAATLFLTFLFQKTKLWFMIGISLALIGLIRTQDLIYGLLLITTINARGVHEIFRGFTSVRFILGFLLGFSPQLLTWQLLYGNFLSNPYLINEGFDFFNPRILEVLFSPTNGLFLWTPITLLAFIELFIKFRESKIFILVFLLQLYLISSWSTWDQGASYSGRMFVSILPILSFGLGNFYNWLSKYNLKFIHFSIIFIIPLSLINFILIIFFLLRN